MDTYIKITIILALIVIVSSITSILFFKMFNGWQKDTVKAKKSCNSEIDELLKRIKVLDKRLEVCEKYIKKEGQEGGKENASYETSALTDQKPSYCQSNKNKPSKKKEFNYTYESERQVKPEELVIPQNVEYEYLTVVDGNLTKASIAQASYYRTWRVNGKLYFEFYSDKIAKAINNRSVIIEPFCDKDPDSVPADKASGIETCKVGTLNEDYSLNTRTTIKFI